MWNFNLKKTLNDIPSIGKKTVMEKLQEQNEKN